MNQVAVKRMVIARRMVLRAPRATSDERQRGAVELMILRIIPTHFVTQTRGGMERGAGSFDGKKRRGSYGKRTRDDEHSHHMYRHITGRRCKVKANDGDSNCEERQQGEKDDTGGRERCSSGCVDVVCCTSRSVFCLLCHHEHPPTDLPLWLRAIVSVWV